ncbi:hypothetical protein L6452_44739 [Arctium lappa]|nr:hypothetical protein L6452_44739 [Arctium lappa]
MIPTFPRCHTTQDYTQFKSGPSKPSKRIGADNVVGESGDRDDHSSSGKCEEDAEQSINTKENELAKGKNAINTGNWQKEDLPFVNSVVNSSKPRRGVNVQSNKTATQSFTVREAFTALDADHAPVPWSRDVWSIDDPQASAILGSLSGLERSAARADIMNDGNSAMHANPCSQSSNERRSVFEWLSQVEREKELEYGEVQILKRPESFAAVVGVVEDGVSYSRGILRRD